VGHTGQSSLDDARDKPRMAGPQELRIPILPRCAIFEQRRSVDHFLGGLQVRPEAGARRRANELSVARFPTERLDSKEDSLAEARGESVDKT